MNKKSTPRRNAPSAGRSFLRRAPVLLLAAATTAWSPMLLRAVPSPDGGRTAALVPGGDEIERPLQAGETHTFSIALEAEHYIDITIERRGVRTAVTWLDPAGATVAELPVSPAPWGTWELAVVTQDTGAYRLEVRSGGPKALSGPYRLRLGEARAAAAGDRQRVAVRWALVRAEVRRAAQSDAALREALELYRKARDLAATTGDRHGEAVALVGLGAVEGELDETEESLRDLARAAELYHSLNDSLGAAVATARLADVHFHREEHAAARPYYEEALKTFRELGERYHEAATVAMIARSEAKLGRYRTALELHLEALAVQRAIGDRGGQAGTLNNLGLCRRKLGEMEEGLELYGQAIELWRQLGDRRGEATALHNTGVTWRILGDNDKAMETLRRVLGIYRELGDRGEEAYTLRTLGGIEQALGESQRALESCHRALAIYREIDDPYGQAATLNYLGVIFRHLGRSREAAEYYEQTLALIPQMDAPRLEFATLHNLGTALAVSRRHEPAMARYRQALAVAERLEDPGAKAAALSGLAQGLVETGDPEPASRLLGEALQLFRSIRSQRGEYTALTLLGRARRLAADPEGARTALLEALTITRALDQRPDEASVLIEIARLERHRGRLREALDRIGMAISLLEALRASVTSPSFRASFFADARRAWETDIAVRMDLDARQPDAGHAAGALAVSESARARLLLETLASAGVDPDRTVDRELVERERTLRSELGRRQLERLRRLAEPDDSEGLAAATRALEDAVAEYRIAQGQLRAASPRAAELSQAASLEPAAIRAGVLDDDTLLLEYFVGAHESFAWALTRTDLRSFRLPSRARLEEQTRRLYELVTERGREVPGEPPADRHARIAHADGEVQVRAAQLSTLLLAPVADLLPGKRLLVVADGALHYLPFAILPVPGARLSPPGGAETSEPLLHRHQILRLPSASVAAVLRHRGGKRRQPDKTVAVLADPVFDADDPRVVSRRPAEAAAGDSSVARGDWLEPAAGDVGLGEFPRLRFSRREAEQVASLVPPASRFLALDFAASRAAATDPSLADYRIVHFATHGLLNSRHPELSCLVLSAVDERGRAQDGFLRLHEIYTLELNADLVVLSGCQTALGAEIRGEGLLGLTRGFLHAGANRVLATLWKVEDRSTAELMRRFYRALLEDGRSPPAALREAQLSMSSTQRWRAPYYWAPFVLVGDGR